MFNAYTIYFYLPLLVAQIKENCVLFRAEKINNFFVGYLKMNKNCKKAINMYICIYYANLSTYAQSKVDFKGNKLMPKNLFQLVVVVVVWMTQLLIESAI